MDGRKLLKILVNAVVIAITILFLLIVAMYISSCGKEEQPMQYKDRMMFAGWSCQLPSKQVGVWIDTETGVCYLAQTDGGMVVMVDHEGKPFIANGWRDYGAED